MATVGTHELVIDSPTTEIDSQWIVRNRTGDVREGTLSKGLYYIQANFSWDNKAWALQQDLYVEVYTSWKEVLAVAHWTIQEYGVGDSLETAIMDLLTSLSDYYQSLEAREDRLAADAADDLAKLRDMLRYCPTN